MKHISLLALVVTLLTASFAIAPVLSNGFGGFAPEYFPVPQYDPPVQPAGYAFAIWGVIYTGLIAGSIYGLLLAAKDPDWQAMRPALAVSLGIGTLWIAAANASPPLATAMIVLMAAAAIHAMLLAGRSTPWFLVRPIALYAGWLTAASGVAIGVALGGYGLLSSQSAALVCLAAVLLVALIVQSRRPDEWAYPLAVIWALTGVSVDNATPLNLPIIALAGLGIAPLGARTVLSLMKGSRR